MMTLTGLSALSVLTKPYIFPGAANDGSINLLFFYLKLNFLCTFESIDSLSLKKVEMDCDLVLQTNFSLTGIQSFQRSLDYQELQDAIPYLINGLILTRRFVCFEEFFFLLW